MRAQEAIQLRNVAAGTTTFFLEGGVYVFDYVGTGTGTVDLMRVGPDGSTSITAMTQLTASAKTNGPLYLPPGQYKIVIATFTANYATLARVPLE